ncbi:ATP-binding cassette domain-containing protein [Caproiciproducens sp. NJN-50]|uniref:methionine ABC transporter ATP-binding protein n=1 Tax=Acutalibacteraceae TaxID=3082771 RepID=UPI000FFE0E82|nr:MULTISPECIES: ATP-binding cassette domain-containing protein [Acutalibacteraceae]QAT50402.1 ATP-binding cassette domain-containing protein [Caproiciproducens sp. NJN-50]
MGQALIEIHNLSKTFQTKDTEIHALNDISLTIEKGDIFGIIGMSGAGKSTLVRCMNMLERPTQGNVLFDGKDLCRLKESDLRGVRRSIGMIFQQFNLLMQRTALENVCFPLEISGIHKSDAKKKARELLDLVGLSDRVESYPTQLSGGQKQRVAIARALATNPKALLCDEATSALDPATTQSILSLLKDINGRLGITIVIITHEMSVIERICNRVAIIDESRIAETGLVEDIFTNPKTAAAHKFVYPDAGGTAVKISKRCMRIVFNGNSSFEPVLAGMVLACKAPVNILYADTKNLNGKAFGQMVVQLPAEEALARKMFHYIRAKGLTAEEVDDYVG